MKPRYKVLLERAINAMLAAIEIHNKPIFHYKLENFVILAINAWELLLKAKWLKDNNKLSSLYVHMGKGNKRKRIKKNRSGNPMTFDVLSLAGKLRAQGALDELAYRNVEAMVELRDNVIHFYQPSDVLTQRVFELGAASVKNFVQIVQDWFNYPIVEHDFYVLPLTFYDHVTTPVEAIPIKRREANFLRYLTSIDSTAVDNQSVESEEGKSSSSYAVTVNVNMRFARSQTADALLTRLSNDLNAMPIRLTDEQIRERYPWDYGKLTLRCKDRYVDFKINKKYHNLRKQFEDAQRYCYIRQLDPGNPRSSKKKFYNPNILKELDKCYTRRKGD